MINVFDVSLCYTECQSYRSVADIRIKATKQPLAVLREVYHGIREILFDEYSEGSDQDNRLNLHGHTTHEG